MKGIAADLFFRSYQKAFGIFFFVFIDTKQSVTRTKLELFWSLTFIMEVISVSSANWLATAATAAAGCYVPEVPAPHDTVVS